VDNGDGSYQYTFYRDPKQAAIDRCRGWADDGNGLTSTRPTSAFHYDATLTHRLASRSVARPCTGSNRRMPSDPAYPRWRMVNTANVSTT